MRSDAFTSKLLYLSVKLGCSFYLDVGTFSYLLHFHTWPTCGIGKCILNELECLLEDVRGAMQDISLFQDDNLGERLNEQACINDKVSFLLLFLKAYVNAMSTFSSDPQIIICLDFS